MTDTEEMKRLRRERDNLLALVTDIRREFTKRDVNGDDVLQAVRDVIAVNALRGIDLVAARKERDNAEKQCADWQHEANDAALMLQRFRDACTYVVSGRAIATDEEYDAVRALCAEYDAIITYDGPATPTCSQAEGEKP